MMKPLVSFLILIGLWAVNMEAQAQGFTPPEAVLAGFHKKFMGESMIYEWREQDGSYIVLFTHQDKYKYARLNAEGFWEEEGEAIDRNDIPESVYAALPELDITAFVHESFRAVTVKDHKGYMLIYETDVERIDIWVTDQGTILRKKHYPIPEEPEEEKQEEKTDEVDWGDGE